MQRLQTIKPVFLLFVLIATTYAVLVLFYSRPPGMSMTNGDEPHYLLQAHSLWYDHDLEMQNNYANLDYTEFFDGGVLDIGAYLYEYNGRTIRHHFALGMPLLLTPAYAIGGRIGVQLLLALLTATGMSWLFLTVRQFIPSPVAFVTVLLCALTYPIVIYSHQIYPETIIMVLMTLVLTLTLPALALHQRRNALVVGTVVGMMPHFQNKFILLSLLLYSLFLWRTRPYLRLTLRWSLPPILLLAIAHLAWAYIIYGELGWSALVSPGYARLIDTRIDDGILGLWFDQEVGLFFFAPLYLLALPGAWILARRPDMRGAILWLIAIYASFHLLGGAYYDWPAGLSPAPRYLVPVLPILVIFVSGALAWSLRHRQLLQPILLILITVYFTYLILFVQRAYMFPFYIGSNSILREHFRSSQTVAWIVNQLPSFLTAIDAAYLKLTLVTIVFSAIMLMAVPLNRLFWRIRKDNPQGLHNSSTSSSRR